MTKPLNQLTKHPTKLAHTTTPKEPSSQRGSIVAHSGHQWEISRHYHKHTASPTRGIEDLNPTTAVPAHRSYPGLAN
jgi:hypothetical protein